MKVHEIFIMRIYEIQFASERKRFPQKNGASPYCEAPSALKPGTCPSLSSL